MAAPLFADPLDAELHSADGQSATSPRSAPSGKTPRALTARQAAILRFICDTFEESGAVPSYREIVAHFGFGSTHAASDHLDLIAKKGFLSLTSGRGKGRRGQARSYRILRLPDGTPVRVRLVPVT